eukprot:jgi/Chlat1/7255/Chrsp58S06871
MRRAPVLLRPLRVAVLAGEPSGDALAGRLVAAVRAERPDTHFAGVAGPEMVAQGVESFFPLEDISVMGLAEVLPRIPLIQASPSFCFRRIHEAAAAVRRLAPDAVVTVDAKGFNLRMLHQLKGLYTAEGLAAPPCVHYVPPSVWAYRELLGLTHAARRRAALSRLVDHFLCILPFEPDIWHKAGLRATFVGHMVVEDRLQGKIKNRTAEHRQLFCERHGISTDRGCLLAFLPGSRRQEAERLLPIYAQACAMLSTREHASLRVVVPAVPSLINSITAATAQWSVPVHVVPSFELYDVFAACDAALVTSGTAVVQALVAGIPLAVAYKAHPLTELAARWLAAVKHVSIPNILLQREVVPEAIFGKCTPDNLYDVVRKLLENPQERALQWQAALKVANMLTASVSTTPQHLLPSQIAARVVLDEINGFRRTRI